MNDNQISLDQLLNEAAGGNEYISEPEDTSVNTDVDEPSSEDTSVNTDVDEPSSDNDSVNKSEEKSKTKTEPKSNPIKEVRDKLNSEQKLRTKIDNAIKRYTNGDYNIKLKDYKNEDGSINYDDLISAMNEIDNDNKAKTNNLTPEVQKEIDRIEREKLELQKERLKITMDKSLAEMQVELNLTSAAINQFFVDALAQKRNPYQWIAQGGDIKDLYYILYRDKMIQSRIDSAVAEERSKWEGTKSNPSPNPATKQKPSVADDSKLSLKDLLDKARV